MRAGMVVAWLAGMGIITWRSIACEKHPPIPGQMLAASGMFALLSLLAEYQPAAGAATALAIGLDLAALLNGFPCGAAPKIPVLARVTGTSGNSRGPQNAGAAPTLTGA